MIILIAVIVLALIYADARRRHNEAMAELKVAERKRTT